MTFTEFDMFEDMKFGEVAGLVDAFRRETARPASARDHGMAVVVLDRGFVYVGRVVTDGDWCVIDEARNIRRWETTKGLGQIILEGPTPRTVLDPAGTVRAPMRAVISIHPTSEELWQ